MQFKLKQFHRDIPKEELLVDLKNAAQKLTAQGRILSFRTYATVGRFSSGTFAARFGSWNKALKEAGIEANRESDVSIDALFENLKAIWIKKGDQPVFRDMTSPFSLYGSAVYIARFGSWRKALQAFVEIVQSDEWVANDRGGATKSDEQTKEFRLQKRNTDRNISERMRFRILLRDGFSCQTCGASPLQDRGVELHVDHILPWSKGGETVEINLQTKCLRCNLGKGNAFSQ